MNNPTQHRSWILRIRGRAAGAVLALAILFGLVVVATQSAQAQTFTAFDVPGAGTGAGQGTIAEDINVTGDIAGYYVDASNVNHSFVRASDGTITTFDAPGAGTGAGQGTITYANNTAGVVTGYYIDASSVYHGFVRAANGTITGFEAPGAGTGANQGTIPDGINASGDVTGTYADVNYVYHGFVRASDGTITSFDAPGAGSGGTTGVGINTAGDIAGNYADANYVNHGFVRASNGTITTFDAPGAGTAAGQGTIGWDINSSGVITGYYFDANRVRHGFVRASDGAITGFEAPGAGTGAGQGTGACCINVVGDIAGGYRDTNNVRHGYKRAANGTITGFEAPGAGTGAGQGTVVGGFNAAEQIAGAYIDASNVYHGFVLTPALQFIPIAPCRVADTRNATGPFGGPSIAGHSSRDFVIPSSACGIPSQAAAYSLNVTVVPHGALGYLTVWPSGQSQPLVSTLNSLDGRIKANAAVVPAGSGGAISVFVTDTTDVVLDINGYFEASSSSTLAFYPLTPCRIADTRLPNAPLGGPYLVGGQSRSLPILSSSCQIPSSAQAYSLNFTAVPRGSLGFLSAWPAGQPWPGVSTLNAPTGTVTANAAIVPAGSNGAIDVMSAPGSDTDVVIDVNGYFAPAASAPGGLSLYSLTPCRALDTRTTTGSFKGTLPVDIETSSCGVLPSAQAFVLNATVVPAGPSLGFLTLWPNGETQPLVSTLNALDGMITSNMAIVPTSNGSIDAFSTDSTQLLLDINGYFAP